MLGWKCGDENAGMKVRGWKCGDENVGMKMLGMKNLGMKKPGDEKPGMKVKRRKIQGWSVTQPFIFDNCDLALVLKIKFGFHNLIWFFLLVRREKDKNIVKIRNEICASRAIRSGSESSDKCVLL